MITEATILANHVDNLQEENQLLRQALEEVEWTGDSSLNYEWCAWCSEEKPDHAFDCLRQRALGLDKEG